LLPDSAQQLMGAVGLGQHLLRLQIAARLYFRKSQLPEFQRDWVWPDQNIISLLSSVSLAYPVGTLVVLDTFELAIVHSASPIPEMLSRPIVRIVSDDRGNLAYPGVLVDLSERTPEGNFRRTIIKTEIPERYGIRVGDYFV
jgi:hypothetical protein